MIYLWDEEGWEEFELTDKRELDKRGIHIGVDALISDEVKIGRDVVIGDSVRIGDGARISQFTVIGQRAFIGDHAYIGGVARIGAGAKIPNRSVIGNRAVIRDGARPVTIHINGSLYPVYYWGEDRIDIGCASKSIEEWLAVPDPAREYDFSPEEIEEYRGYVEFIKSVHQRSAAGGGRGEKEEGGGR